MCDDAAMASRQALAEHRGWNRGGRAGENALRPRKRIHLTIYLLLDVDALGGIFLHVIGFRERLLHGRRGADPLTDPLRFLRDQARNAFARAAILRSARAPSRQRRVRCPRWLPSVPPGRTPWPRHGR